MYRATQQWVETGASNKEGEKKSVRGGVTPPFSLATLKNSDNHLVDRRRRRHVGTRFSSCRTLSSDPAVRYVYPAGLTENSTFSTVAHYTCQCQPPNHAVMPLALAVQLKTVSVEQLGSHCLAANFTLTTRRWPPSCCYFLAVLLLL